MNSPLSIPSVSKAFVDQARHLVSGEYLPRIERCMEQLSDAQVWWRANEESNSIGNLILHLCGNARQWIVSGLGGASDARLRQQEFDERRVIPRAELVALLRQTLKEVDTVLANFEPTRLLDRFRIQETDPSGLEAIFHVTEHFSMHTGQIVLLTKMLTNKDMKFYDFTSGVPVHSWKENRVDGSQ